METSNSIPTTSPPPADGDSVSIEEAKADDRRAQRAKAFQKSMDQGQTTINESVANESVPASNGKGDARPAVRTTLDQSPKANSSSQPGQLPRPLPGQLPKPSQPPLTPALLKLQSQGYPTRTPDPAAKPKSVETEKMAGHEQDNPPVDETTPKAMSQKSDSQSRVKGEAAQVAAGENAIGVNATGLNATGAKTSQAREREASATGRHEDRKAGKFVADSSAPDPRLMSGPVVLPMTQSMAMAAMSPAGRPLPSPELLQQLVEFATVHHTSDGTVEFQLGLIQEALGGLRIKLSAYGNRRVGISVKGGKGATVGSEEVAGLIEALRQRDVEVVDVVLD